MRGRPGRILNSDLEWVERTANNQWYWNAVAAVARAIKSDHCSGVPDFFSEACDEHDIHYRCHKTIFGTPITKKKADWIIGRRIQQRSWFGAWSPMAWWRQRYLERFVSRPWIEGWIYNIEFENGFICVKREGRLVVMFKMQEI